MYKIMCNDTVVAERPTLAHCLAWLNDYENRSSGEFVKTMAQLQLQRGQEIVATEFRFACNHLAPVLDHLGDPQSTILAMLDEMQGHVITADGRALVPCEMVREDWEALRSIGATAYGVIPCFAQTTFTLSNWTEKEFFRRYGYDHNGPHGEFGSNGRHEVHVEYALAVGRPVVPDKVLAAYRGETCRLGMAAWGLQLVNKPFLRGLFRSGHAAAGAISFCLRQGVELSPESAPAIAAGVTTLPKEFTSVDLDDWMYAQGLIPPLPATASVAAPNAEQPHSELARQIGEAVRALRRSGTVERIQRDRQSLRMSQREYERAMQDTTDPSVHAEAQGWANKVANLIERRDLAQMLKLLDTSSGMEASQKVCEAYFGVKLRNCKAAQRRLAVFKMAGIEGAEAVAAAEKQLAEEAKLAAEARERANRPRRLAHARATAARHRTRVDGHIMSVAEYVEERVAKGFTVIREYKRGAAVDYRLFNPSDGLLWTLRKKDGGLDYARLLIEQTQDAAETV